MFKTFMWCIGCWEYFPYFCLYWCFIVLCLCITLFPAVKNREPQPATPRGWVREDIKRDKARTTQTCLRRERCFDFIVLFVCSIISLIWSNEGVQQCKCRGPMRWHRFTYNRTRRSFLFRWLFRPLFSSSFLCLPNLSRYPIQIDCQLYMLPSHIANCMT